VSALLSRLSITIEYNCYEKDLYNDSFFKKYNKYSIFGDAKMLWKFKVNHHQQNNFLQVSSFWKVPENKYACIKQAESSWLL